MEENTREVDAISEADKPPGPTPASTYFGFALLAGVVSILLTPLPFAIIIGIVSPGLFDLRVYAAYSFYSALAIMPISIVIAYPLIIIFKNQSRLSRLVISLMAGAILGSIVYLHLNRYRLNTEVLIGTAVGAAYGATFGYVAVKVPTQKK